MIGNGKKLLPNAIERFIGSVYLFAKSNVAYVSVYVCERLIILLIHFLSFYSVLQKLHGFTSVDAFLRHLFDKHANTWFERYLSRYVE